MSEAKQGIVDQFRKWDRHVTGVHDLSVREGSGALGTLSAIAGGLLRADRLEVVTATGPLGPECIVQPFHGHSVLPGEYHLTIPGALRTPVEYLRKRGGTWNAGDDDEIVKWCKSLELDTYLLPDELKQGFTRIKLESVFQLVPISTAASHLVFTLGGIHAMIDLKPYVPLAEKLAAAIAASVGPGAMPPLGTITFTELVAAAHAGQLDGLDSSTDEPPSAEPPSAEPPAQRDPRDVTARLHGALSPHTDKRVLLAPIDGKALDNILKKVAKDVPADAVVAFLDTGMRASGKAGWAFTSDAVHISQIGENWAIPYADIRSFRREKTKAVVDSRLTGAIKCDVTWVEDLVVPALEAATGLTATS